MKINCHFKLAATILLLLTGVGSAVGAISNIEREALITLYNSTNGDNWTNKSNWLGPPGTEDTWYGVTCDSGQNHVVRLKLDSNNLVGQIPPELGNLRNLVKLDLRANKLSGSIPPELGNLTKLEVFDLRANKLSGSIPPELGNLRNLVKLDLRADQNPCFFYVGGIKSIAGIKPSTELFDIFIKFNYWKYICTFASIDFAFTEKDDEEAEVKPAILTEASISINVDLNSLIKTQDRHMFVGFNTKIFDGVPYYGVHFGSFETNDTLFSSYFLVGYLRRWYGINQEKNAILDKKEFKNNLFVEFALHSPKLPFIKNIRLKGGILLPFQDKTGRPDENDIKVRIVIEIPLGPVIKF